MTIPKAAVIRNIMFSMSWMGMDDIRNFESVTMGLHSPLDPSPIALIRDRKEYRSSSLDALDQGDRFITTQIDDLLHDHSSSHFNQSGEFQDPFNYPSESEDLHYRPQKTPPIPIGRPSSFSDYSYFPEDYSDMVLRSNEPMDQSIVSPPLQTTKELLDRAEHLVEDFPSHYTEPPRNVEERDEFGDSMYGLFDEELDLAVKRSSPQSRSR